MELKLLTRMVNSYLMVKTDFVDVAELTIEEVRNAVKRLRNSKAVDDDGVLAKLMEYGGEAVNDWIFEVLTKVWRERKV